MSSETLPLDDIGRWYTSTRRLSWPLRRLWLRLELEDAGNVPPDGPVVLAANHLSFLDSLLLMYSLPRRVTFLGKAEYLQGRITRTLFPAAGMIAVDRTGRGVGRSLEQAADRLRSGEIVGIFPEGTRSRDGRLYRGHPGVAHLALRTGAPIVPVGIVGTDLAQPPGARIPRRAEVRMRFGPPVDLGRWAGVPSTGSVKREITDETMRAVAALSGQDHVDEYAPVIRREETGRSVPLLDAEGGGPRLAVLVDVASGEGEGGEAQSVGTP